MKKLLLLALLPAIGMAGIPINVPSRNPGTSQQQVVQKQIVITVHTNGHTIPYIHYMTIKTINGELVVYRIEEY